MTYPYDLGRLRRRVTTGSVDAQHWFDRGLVWTYAYHHEEAIACFERALADDAGCAMAHWGVAYGLGPNYNKPWEAFDPDDLARSLQRARDHLVAAQAHPARLMPVEQALIGALVTRYPDDPNADLAAWSDAYAAAMRRVHAAYPNDLDVKTLFAEALMNRTPWQLWDLRTGDVAEGASTAEARAVLEDALERFPEAWSHPGILHMYVHLMEMSSHPELALKAGDALFDLVPDAGHLRHMPTHVDVLCGHYATVVRRNQAAVRADRRFLERAGPINFYSLYRCHNYHFVIYGAMFLGQYRIARAAAEEMIQTLPEAVLTVASPPMADWLEGFVPMLQHVLIRFGKWDEIIAQRLPDDPELFCVTTAMMRYARTVAMAATGDVVGAETERRLFREAKARVPESRMLFNNTCQAILEVAEAMLEGELAYRQGDHDAAFDHLRRSVALDDALPYDEPWGWMQPTRHALGALLLEQGRVVEAAAVYRADLGLDGTLARACQHPDNVWSLHGLHECLVRQGRQDEARMIRPRLDIALARADVPIRASCYCRMHHAA
ncbi:MAG: hypothetical protein EA356_15070 [Geminicoccaceae bacterium]|nr:MAG: hypothetical protein EA356_15070 [Geminicoccaceae bacterium]